MKFIPKKPLTETTIVEEIPPLPPQEVVEDVVKDKGYNYEAVAEIITKELQATEQDYDYIFDTVEQTSIDPEDMTPEEVDEALNIISSHYGLSEELMKVIEDKISALKSPQEIKQEEEKSNLESDYDTLKRMISDERFESSYTYDFLYEAIQKMEDKINELNSFKDEVKNDQ